MGIQPELCNSFMNRRICSSSSSEAGSETAGRTHSCRFCSKLCGVGPACQQTHTPCWVAQLAGLQSTGRCATATIGRAYHNPQTRALSFDMPQLLSPLCLHGGMPGSTARPSTAGAAGRTLLPGPTIQPPLLLLPWPVVGLFFLIL